MVEQAEFILRNAQPQCGYIIGVVPSQLHRRLRPFRFVSCPIIGSPYLGLWLRTNVYRAIAIVASLVWFGEATTGTEEHNREKRSLLQYVYIFMGDVEALSVF